MGDRCPQNLVTGSNWAVDYDTSVVKDVLGGADERIKFSIVECVGKRVKSSAFLFSGH